MSFSDNFQRDQGGDFEYDYSAFWTYGATFLIIFLIPLLNKIKNRIFYSPRIMDKKEFINCGCVKCQEKLRKYCTRKKRENYGFSFYFIIITIVVICYLLQLAYEEIILNDGKIKGFNPWEILEIEEHEPEERVIKKAFRRLSVTYHPDRNDSPDAKPKFIMITKAYECLTDPIAKENFKNFGNPDGAGSMRVGIALPPFVYEKKNHIPILAIFLIFIIFILPATVYYWYNTTQQYDESGVRVENHKNFYEYLNENVLLKQMPFIVGSAIEYENLKLVPEQYKFLDQCMKTYKDKFPKHQKPTNFNSKKAICLIYLSLDENNKIPQDVEEDVTEVMNKVPDLIYALYKITMQCTFLYYQYSGYFEQQSVNKNAIKKLGYNCVKSILEFSQCAHQSLSFNSSPLLQLPHFNTDVLRSITK
jgi:translocation protein SEC63